MAEVVALLAERREEIRAIFKLYKELRASLGEDTAEHVLGEAISAESEASGKRSAPGNPDEAGLADFARALRSRDGDGGLETGEVTIDDDMMTIEVTRCDYHALYRTSSLSPALAQALSCGREAAFAKGYDSRLRLVNLEPPSCDKRSCHLTYQWRPNALPSPKGPVVRLKFRDS